MGKNSQTYFRANRQEDVEGVVRLLTKQDAVITPYLQSNHSLRITDDNEREINVLGERGNLVLCFGSAFLIHHIHGRKSISIEDIVVRQEYRQMGIGSELLRYLINWGTKMNCYKVTLSCTQSNSAFYTKNGFSANSLGMVMYTKVNGIN